MTRDGTIRVAKPHYLPHVDGLRGISVLLVMAYHAWPGTLPGGFIGVDVFFVISGFLITRLLMFEARAGSIGYRRFLMRRMRRLWPSFALVTAVTLGLGWILLGPAELLALGEAAMASTVFSSNWYFASGFDYFNEAQNQNFLLHTWSLAVEEQFYLVYPLILIVLGARPRTLVVGIGLIWILSFGSVLFSAAGPASFFGTHLRVWEVATGAMAWFGFRRGWHERGGEFARRALALLGLALILASAIAISGQLRFPGPVTLVPVFGASLCILYGARLDGQDRSLSNVLGARWLIRTGLLSYALYLWHWPILKALQTLIPDPADWQLLLALFLSTALARLAYRFVEKPIRRAKRLRSDRALLSVVVAGSALFILFGWQARDTGGFPSRIPKGFQSIQQTGPDDRSAGLYCDNAEEVLSRIAGADIFDEAFDLSVQICEIGNRARGVPDVLYWGDSHLRMIRSELAARFTGADQYGLIVTRAACPPLPGVAWSHASEGEAQTCAKLNRAMLQFIKATEIERTVLVAHWDFYAPRHAAWFGRTVPGMIRAVGTDTDQLQLFDTAFAEMVFHVSDLTDLHVLVDVPTHDFDVLQALSFSKRWPWLPDPNWMTQQKQEAHRAHYLPQMTALAAKGAVTLHDPLTVFCPQTACLADIDGVPLFYDYGRVSQAGAGLLLDALPGLIEPGN